MSANLLQLSFIYISVLIVNIFYACTSYSPIYRNNNAIIYAAILNSIISNVAWVLLVKIGVDNHRIFWYSVLWELVMIVPYYIVPLFFFGLNLSIVQLFGLAAIIIGTALLRLGSPG